MEAEELRRLRATWVDGAFPTTGPTQEKAALVIDSLVRECFKLRREKIELKEENKRLRELLLQSFHYVGDGRTPLDTEQAVQYVGCYVLKWGKLEHPTMGFWPWEEEEIDGTKT